MAHDDEHDRQTPPPHEDHHPQAHEEHPPRAHNTRGFVATMLTWVPIVVVPVFGWIWHTENKLTSMEVRVADLEEQVDNYRATEKTLIEVKAHLDDLRESLHRDAARGGSTP